MNQLTKKVVLEDIRSVRLYTFHELFILLNIHFEGEKYQLTTRVRMCVHVCVFLFAFIRMIPVT